MAIKLMQGFNITSTSSIDTRFVLSKAEMLAVDENLMPEKYFTLCSNDNKIYVFDKNAVSTPTTGKFRVIETDISIVNGYYFNELFYTDSTYTVECEKNTKFLYIDKNSNGGLYSWNGLKYNRSVQGATSAIAGILKLYQVSGYNTDGTMSQKAITEGVQSIKFAVDDNDNECLVLDLPWD